MQKIWKVFVASFLILACACGTNQNTQTDKCSGRSRRRDRQIAIVYFCCTGDNYQKGVIEKGNSSGINK